VGCGRWEKFGLRSKKEKKGCRGRNQGSSTARVKKRPGTSLGEAAAPHESENDMVQKTRAPEMRQKQKGSKKEGQRARRRKNRKKKDLTPQSKTVSTRRRRTERFGLANASHGSNRGRKEPDPLGKGKGKRGRPKAPRRRGGGVQPLTKKDAQRTRQCTGPNSERSKTKNGTRMDAK